LKEAPEDVPVVDHPNFKRELRVSKEK